jgi:hypothetical protein
MFLNSNERLPFTNELILEQLTGFEGNEKEYSSATTTNTHETSFSFHFTTDNTDNSIRI